MSDFAIRTDDRSNMKQSQNINATPLISLHAAVLDTETTGLRVSEDRIVQIGGVLIEGMGIDEENVLDVLVNPGIPIAEASSKIHGIYDQDVEDIGRFSSVVEKLNTFLQDRILIGHNIGFDIAVLEKEFERAGQYWQEILYLDTMILARTANPHLPDYSLESLSTWLEIDIRNRHTALGDAQATAEIFLGLVPHLKSRGVRTLAEAYSKSAEASEIIESHLKSGWKPPLSEQAGD
ncbi:MAG: 3'-5' exonuclease, partial [Methyloligellaceae bacterium]